MSITKYEVKCDRCGVVFPTSNMKIISYHSLVWQLKHLNTIGWKADGKQKQYCPDCAQREIRNED